MLKMKKVGVIGANKTGKTFAGHDLGKDFLNEDFGGEILSG